MSAEPVPDQSPHNREEEDEEEEEALQFKIIVLGDGAVGKTSICMRFCDDHFAAQYKQTIGVDFMSKKLVLPGKTKVTVQIWDIGGQSLGSKMIRNYIYGAQAVLLCYDITNYQSFQDLSDWLGLVKKTFAPSTAAGSGALEAVTMPYLALVGNKYDLLHLRAVTQEKHDQFATDNRTAAFFCSAKTGDTVNPMFTKVVADLAGVELKNVDLEVRQQVVTAAIINHKQNEDGVQKLQLQTEKTKCIVM